MQGWKYRSLSIDGRFTLSSACIGPVSYHVMSVVKLPKTLLSKLDKYMRNFFWGGDNDRRSMHNVNWPTVSMTKDLGGVNVRDLEISNLSVLAKMGWEFCLNPIAL